MEEESLKNYYYGIKDSEILQIMIKNTITWH